MNERSLRVLEWPKIKEQLKEHAAFSLGIQAVERLEPKTKEEEVIHHQELTSEALLVIWKSGDPPFGGANDVFSLLERALIGGMLEPDQFLSIAGVLYCIGRMKKYLQHVEGKLRAHYEALTPLPSLAQEISRCIEEDGRVKDHASPELAKLRQKLQTLANRVREKLDSIVHSSSYQKMLQEGIVTIRSNRYVVPVKQEYRSQFPGIVHDQSGSGATLFIEPAAVVELNNQLRITEQEELAEIKRILLRLTRLVQGEGRSIEKSLSMLGDLDFIFAKAKYSRRFNAQAPEITSTGELFINQGRHPLLTGTVVPIGVWLRDPFFMLVVTGPNTGGKTVTLKTVGLFCLMAQAGLHIPTLPGSKVPVFQGIYADIGDEQSIEQSLSTFSSHMTNIVEILAHCDEQSLVLFDELGAGTDPGEGAALATALLDYLRERRVRTIATTHYSQLKNFAFAHDEVENASVEFDVATLSPTYKLSIGIPGKSNALAIAKRLGLSDVILEKAQVTLGEEVQVDKIITDMEVSRRATEQAQQEAYEYRAKLSDLKEKYEKHIARLETERKRVLEEAHVEARELLSATKRELDALVGELRRQGGTSLEAEIKATRQRLTDQEQILEKQRPEKEKVVAPRHLKPGEQVYIKSLRQEATVIEPENSSGDVLVMAGIMKVSLKATDLERRSTQKTKVTLQSRFVGGIGKGKSETIRQELDLRGMNLEEAWSAVDKYLDDAFLASLSRVRIIHGKGTGTLRQGITEQLKKHPHVKGYKLGEANEGGSGVTTVDLAVTKE